MPIVFEKTLQFDSLPDGNLYEQLAERHLLGKKFNSLEEALNQEWIPGCTLAAHGFKVGEIKAFTPKGLPVAINEVEICATVHYRRSPKDVNNLIPILMARYNEQPVD